MPQDKQNIVWLCCGVLENEIRALHRAGQIQGELIFLPSMLHMNPPNLDKKITFDISKLSKPHTKIILVYGDCSPEMLNYHTKNNTVYRVNAINCVELLCGKQQYKKFMHEGAFVLIPEWAPRWKHIFTQELGLDNQQTRELMQENRSSLVYLDTGLVPTPQLLLEECASYTGLELRIENIGLETLARYLNKTLES